MGIAYIEGAGGGGVMSSDVTASKADILAGKYDIASDSNDEVVQGTMPNRGAVSQSLAINGTYTIPAGYHNGSGKVTQSITTKAAATYYATTSDQTIASGQYLSGNQTIKKLTQTNLTGANIKPGVTISVNNGNANVWSVAGTMPSKAAATYYPTTSDQTIAAGQYLSGAQTIKAVSQQNLSAGNIKKGVTVYVKNGNGNIYAVTGTWEGYVASTDDLYNHGQYGQYGTLTFNSNTTAVIQDMAQITFRSTSEAWYTNAINFAMITPVAINMARYTRLTIEGTTALGSSGATTYTSTVDLYVDLLNSIPSGSERYSVNTSAKHLTLGTKSQTGHEFTWTNPVITWSAQNTTKYLRVLWRQSSSGAYSIAGGSWVRLTLS